MIQNHLGEWAALGTACCWTITAIFFESASKKVGSLSVNWIRLVLAFIFLCGYSWVVRRIPLPIDASPHLWLWLSLSGFTGFFLGDLLLFRAFVEIGSRKAMLIMSIVPAITAMMGWIILGERLLPVKILAMILTILGISIVVLRRNQENCQIEFSHPIRGIMLAFGGAVGQALGLVLSRYGMDDDHPYDAFAATQIRVITGILGFSVLFFLMKRWSRLTKAYKNRSAMASVSAGAFFGPFLGVSLSLYAIQKTYTGIASTIMAIVPILLIPPSIFLYKEHISTREILGAIIAVGGVAILFL